MRRTIGAGGTRSVGRMLCLAVAVAIGISVGPVPVRGAGGSEWTDANAAVVGSGPISLLKVVGSPFYPNGDGVRERVELD
jgi:hypothetical protein